MGRFFRYGELPLVLLALLAEEPMSGYQLMGELGRLFPGYRPSPGSVYPALEALSDERLVAPEERDGATAYVPTEVGHRSLGDRRELLAEIEARTGARLQTGTSLDGALTRFAHRVRTVAGRLSVNEIEERLVELADELEAAASIAATKEGAR